MVNQAVHSKDKQPVRKAPNADLLKAKKTIELWYCSLICIKGLICKVVSCLNKAPQAIFKWFLHRVISAHCLLSLLTLSSGDKINISGLQITLCFSALSRHYLDCCVEQLTPSRSVPLPTCKWTIRMWVWAKEPGNTLNKLQSSNSIARTGLSIICPQVRWVSRRQSYAAQKKIS